MKERLYLFCQIEDRLWNKGSPLEAFYVLNLLYLQVGNAARYPRVHLVAAKKGICDVEITKGTTK